MRAEEKTRSNWPMTRCVTAWTSIYIDEEIKRIEQQIAQTLDDDPTLRGKRELQASISGLGERTLAILLGMRTFRQGPSACRLRGLECPRTRVWQ